MSGPAPKPAGQRQRRNKPARLEKPPAPLTVVTGGRTDRDVPPPPSGLDTIPERHRDPVLARWNEFWQSDLVQAVPSPIHDQLDMQALERLFVMYGEEAALHEAFLAEPVTSGSKNQLILNPLGRHLATLRTSIQGLEDRFGLNPRGRLTLGVALGEAHRSLEMLTTRITEPAPDPRADAK